MSLPYIYIRDKPKAHGLKNRIEGLDADDENGPDTEDASPFAIPPVPDERTH